MTATESAAGSDGTSPADAQDPELKRTLQELRRAG